MTRHTSLAVSLAFLIAWALPSQAKKFPNARDGEPPRNTVTGLYRAPERTPVYRSTSPGERPIFYLPRNSRVQIEGKFGGWGIFSTYIAERFKSLLQEAAPDADAQYGWVRLEGLRNVEPASAPCPDIPPASSEDDYFGCGGEYENANGDNVVVFLMGYRHAGRTYRRIDNSRLNQCIKTCRDDGKCSGFFYSSATSTCELKDSGGVDFEGAGTQAPPGPIFAGVKLVD